MWTRRIAENTILNDVPSDEVLKDIKAFLPLAREITIVVDSERQFTYKREEV